mgnify:CR=1 FL=1
MLDKVIKIRCPFCNTEYLPAEIYTNIIGKPRNIIKDEENKIISFTGTSLDLMESFNCNTCNKDFNVTAQLVFTTSYTKNEEYKTKIERKNLFLDEN